MSLWLSNYAIPFSFARGMVIAKLLGKISEVSITATGN